MPEFFCLVPLLWSTIGMAILHHLKLWSFLVFTCVISLNNLVPYCLMWHLWWTVPGINLKNKTCQLFYQQKCLHLGIAENCNWIQASYGKTLGNSREQRRGLFFYRGKVVSRGAAINKSDLSFQPPQPPHYSTPSSSGSLVPARVVYKKHRSCCSLS